MEPTGDYLKELKKRSKDSHVYVRYQLVGLEIAQVLGDQKHKALYIKLAKDGDPEELMRIAKTVADNRNVKNKGAYFMSCLPKQARGQTQTGTQTNADKKKMKSIS